MIKSQQLTLAQNEQQSIKCVVWDLDHTLWDGILLEDDNVQLRPQAVEIVQELDQRGILNSIASRNDHDAAWQKLEQLGIEQYFLYPQINWNRKSQSVENIAKSINIGLDTLAFVDDQPFEREEVAFAHDEVVCFDSAELHTILSHARMMPRFITEESRLRRQLYQSDITREQAKDNFEGQDEAFLANLDMEFEIRVPTESDLQRAEELTIRTHQLNTTGYTYSYDELDQLRYDDDHLLLVATLTDKYGTYGTIGLALVEKGTEYWNVKLLLMSCRVMSRGVGTIVMSYIMQRAQEAGAKLRAHFIPNGRNRMMFVTYKFSGFNEIDKIDDLVILENDLTHIQPYPDYVQLSLPDNLSESRSI